MPVWTCSLISVFLVSLFSFIGVLFFTLKEKKLRKILLFLVSFAAGGLLGGAFIHLLPEAVGEGCGFKEPLLTLIGILFWKNLFVGVIAIFLPQKSTPTPLL